MIEVSLKTTAMLFNYKLPDDEETQENDNNQEPPPDPRP